MDVAGLKVVQREGMEVIGEQITTVKRVWVLQKGDSV